MRLLTLCTQYEGIRVLAGIWHAAAGKSYRSSNFQLVSCANKHPIIGDTTSPLPYCACDVKFHITSRTGGKDCDRLWLWLGLCIGVIQTQVRTGPPMSAVSLRGSGLSCVPRFLYQVHLKPIIDLFTYTAAILYQLDLRSIMGCPGGTRSVFTRAFRANFSLKFPRKWSSWEKKLVVPCLNVIMIAFSPRNIQWSSLFARSKSARKYRASAPGHPIILLESNKLNMAAISVKRSIGLWSLFIKKY